MDHLRGRAIAASEPRGSFGRWLLAQAGRDDWIGDLARAAKNDPGFPRRGESEDVLRRVRSTAADGDMWQAARAAEREWREGCQCP
ncbi:hypothetical protein CLG96_02200 [Sphingomonas oleivorans]|uniref:YozE SAM-like domain-containing protein n=2 Tax=Sphingomonas oleivorans TaxID=1735121 RepID=A0A2T5G1E5_9SPHN|nr:hypothetical protein CLG96_02200 [Sphingomonas oleivorans]